MRTHMPACTGIIAQTIEAQGNKKSIAAVMQVYYAGSRRQSSRSSTTFSDHALAIAEDLRLGLVPAGFRRDCPLGARARRVGLDGLQPIVDSFHGATDL